jgi:hypothetical protein
MMPGQSQRPKRKPSRIRLQIYIIAIILLGVASATTVTISKTTYADFSGFFLKPYYENINAPVTGCTVPCLTVDTQVAQPGTSGSFSLPASSSMYLWTPQFTTSASIPAGALSLQLFADLPAPSLDGNATGTWVTGASFAIAPFSTTSTNDVVVLSIETYLSGSSVTVSSVSDTLLGITWQGAPRKSFVSCTGTQESTHIEWYGTAANALTADTIVINLSTTPTSASGISFGISGSDTTTPFDPAAGLPATAVSSCSNGNSSPTLSGVSTAADTDLVFSLFGAYQATTETAGTIGGTTATLVTAVAGTGDSNAVEYIAATTAQSSVSCTFGAVSKFWNILCDAIMPARRSITVSYATTNSAGTVQSTMISGSSTTITAVYALVSVSSSAGTIPASGYVRVVITAPSGAGLTVFWGAGKPTEFQVASTYRS